MRSGTHQSTTEQPEYTWREIAWMWSKHYEVRRFGERVSFFKKSQFDLLALSIICMAGAVVTLGLAFAKGAWDYDLLAKPPATVETWLCLSLMLGGFGVVLYAVKHLRRRGLLVLRLDLEGKRAYDAKDELIAPFDQVRIDHQAAHAGWNTRSGPEPIPYYFHRYWLRGGGRKIEFYFTTVEAHHKLLATLFREHGLPVKDIR